MMMNYVLVRMVVEEMMITSEYSILDGKDSQVRSSWTSRASLKTSSMTKKWTGYGSLGSHKFWKEILNFLERLEDPLQLFQNGRMCQENGKTES